MTNKNKKLVSAVYAGVFAAATVVAGSIHQLPMPPPSEYVDAESSVNVSLPTNESRRIRLTLGFDSSPSNAVQVAFGCDADGNGDLAPEETAARVGIDCGVPFALSESKSKVEVEQWNFSSCSAGRPEQEANILCSTSTSNFDLKQPKDVSSRWNLAKVTTHNVTGTNVTVSAKFYKPGLMLLVR